MEKSKHIVRENEIFSPSALPHHTKLYQLKQWLLEVKVGQLI